METIIYSCRLLGLEGVVESFQVSASSGTGPAPAVSKHPLQFRLEALAPLLGDIPKTNRPLIRAAAGLRLSAEFDLAIAAGLLTAAGPKAMDLDTGKCCWIGAIGPSGDLLPLKGALSMAMEARKKGFKKIILPICNAREAALVNQIEVIGLGNIGELKTFLLEPGLFQGIRVNTREEFFASQSLPPAFPEKFRPDPIVLRVLEIAAAGGFSILLEGPVPRPGLLGQILRDMLPPPGLQEALEITRIYSAAGKIPDPASLFAQRPLRIPRYSMPMDLLTGDKEPGEFSLAHRGILLLDQLPEYPLPVQEVLCHALNTGLTPAHGELPSWPASFQVLAIRGTCPCGNYGQTEKACHCSPEAITSYRQRILPALGHRLELQVDINRVGSGLPPFSFQPSLSDIRNRVTKLRTARLQVAAVQAQVADPVHKNLLNALIRKRGLDPGSLQVLLGIAKTIADLDGKAAIQPEHLAEASLYRLPVN
jgi:magnesium chelatase family protein